MAAAVLASAQTAGARCGDADPEISISACSGIIQSGRLGGRDLAVAHTHRGVAYVALLERIEAEGAGTDVVRA